MRHRLIVPLLVAGLLAGCSSSPPAEVVADQDSSVALADLRADLVLVAEAQAGADERLNEVLASVRAVDEAVAGLENPTTFDDRLEGYGAVHQQVEETDVDGLRQPLFAIAEAVDTARATLARARGTLDADWEVAYLDAQDAVLASVRDYAETSDRLAQLLVRHWPTFVDVDERVVDFSPRRGNYRDTPEATAALAVELDPVLDDLVVAEAQIAEYRDRRAAAGQRVNEASDAAVAAYERRPGASAG